MFVRMTNGSVSMQLRGDLRPYEAQLRRGLGLLDGVEHFAYLIYFVPDEVGWPDTPGLKKGRYEESFLQSAGSASGMTIEIKRLEDDGQYHQYAVGRDEPAGSADLVDVHYADFTLTVPRSEVFTADEATPVYYHYFRMQTLPEGVHLRELDLS